MELGTTFLPDVAGSHLHVVVSDPQRDPENVLLVSLTTERDYKDRACVLPRGVHPWVTHATCVAYYRMRIVKLRELYAGKDAGAFRIQDPASPAMVKAIQEGLERSTQIKNQIKTLALEILRKQGFLQAPEGKTDPTPPT
jgi:hypothetical protein